MSLDAERRAGLLTAKLTALVRDHAAEGSDGGAPRPVAFGPSAGLVVGTAGWVLVEGDADAALGPALAWAGKHGVEQLHLVVDGEAGALARRAELFALAAGAPQVWVVRGRALVAARAEPLDAVLEPPADELALAAVLVGSGAEVVVEHGVVRGEVAGLEVARVVRGDDGEARLAVGVGHHDRDAFSMVYGDLAPDAALAMAVATVAEQRRPGAPRHPLNQLCAARWLRHRLVADPAPLGLAVLAPVEGPVPRVSLLDRSTAFAVGRSEVGDEVLIACSVGVDLDLVPTAVDLWAARWSHAALRVVAPAADVLPVTHRLADAAVAPVEVVALDHDWRA